jgi:hypothetical protein
VVELQTASTVTVEDTLAVNLVNNSEATIVGTLAFDAALFAAEGTTGNASAEVTIPPGTQQVVTLRARAGTAGQVAVVEFVNPVGTNARGKPVPVRIEGDGHVAIRAR